MCAQSSNISDFVRYREMDVPCSSQRGPRMASMKFTWKPQLVPLKFLFGDRRLFSVELKLQTCALGLMDIAPVRSLDLRDLHVEALDSSLAGFFIRRLPISQEQPSLRWLPQFVWYVTSQDPRYYIDLT